VRLPVLYRINAWRLKRKAVSMDSMKLQELVLRIEEVLDKKNICTVAVAGAPGTGKSKAARIIREQGFFRIPPERLFVIDDLKGPGGERYSRKDIDLIIKKAKGKALFMFDFRAASYLKKADFGILLHLEEKKRLMNLKSRSERSYRRYRKRYYRLPPFPLRFNSNNTYVCSENFSDMVRTVYEGLY
jgi:hypothetical protein